MRQLAVVVFAALLTGELPSPSASPSSSLDVWTGRLDTMLRTGHAAATWFSPSFLSQVPASKADEVIASLKQTLGAYQRVEFTPEKFIARFARGTDDVLMHVGAGDTIDGLLFKPPVVTASPLEDALGALQRLPGTLSYVIVEGDRSALAAFTIPPCCL